MLSLARGLSKGSVVQLSGRVLPTISERYPSIRSGFAIAARYKSRGAFNTCVIFVPEREAWVVERFGKFHRILSPGLNFLVPVIDRIKYIQSLKELVVDIPKQTAITSDNVNLQLDGVLYLKVLDAYRASYGVEDAEYAITQLAQTTMRSEIGKISLDTVFKDREALNAQIVAAINKASDDWGLTCLRYEIRDLALPKRVQDAMQLQVEAERKKRATVLESEGVREADINIGEGKKRAQILASEAQREQTINLSVGEARAIEAVARAQALSLEVIIRALNSDAHASQRAVSWQLAQRYVEAFEKLAKTSNTVVLPANANDTVGMVTQALTAFSAINRTLDLSAKNAPASVSSAVPELETAKSALTSSPHSLDGPETEKSPKSPTATA